MIRRDGQPDRRYRGAGGKQVVRPRVPHIDPTHREITATDFLAICKELPPWARDVFSFLYYSGWRNQEACSLEWSGVNLDEGIVQIERKGRWRPRRVRRIGDGIATVLERRLAERREDTELVFHRAGKRIVRATLGNHYRAARDRAGCPNVMLDDCYRPGEAVDLYEGRARVGCLSEVLADYLLDAERRDVAALRSLRRACELAVEILGDRDVHEVKAIDLYRLQQALAQRYATGTVNRMIAAVMAGLRFAARLGRIEVVPLRPRALRPAEPRQGFLEWHDYQAVLGHLPPWARDVFSFAYYSGWRKREILGLEWTEIQGDVIRLRPGRSKNRRSRTLPMSPELGEIIERRRGQRVSSPLVFHREGEPILDQTFGHYFRRATKAAGRPGMYLHDCRRTTVRDLVRGGVDPAIAMKITGHETRAIFDRYNIVNEEDLADALERRSRYLERRNERR